MEENELKNGIDSEFNSSYEEMAESIADYYKNENSDGAEKETSQINDTPEPIEEEQPKKKKKFSFIKFNEKSNARVIGGTKASGEIQDTDYGINDRKKFIIYLSSSIVVSIGIICGSAFIALKLPHNSEVDNEYLSELRGSEDYISLQKEYAGLNKEVNDLTEALQEKKEKAEFIDDYDNKKAELTSKIESRKQEINDITYDINQQQAEITRLDKIISDRAGTIITLSPGRYVVGSNIAAGKYSISGAGKLSVASSDNKSKVNTVIGSSAYEVTLEEGDIVNIDMSAKFTSIN